MSSILVLDDDPDIRMILKRFLKDKGYFPVLYEKTRHAEISLTTIKPDLALLDINLPGEEHGVSFGWRLRKSWPDIPIIIMSAELDKWEKSDIYDCCADEIIEKPFNLKNVGSIIERLLEEGHTQRSDEF